MKKLFLIIGLMTSVALLGKAQIELEAAEAKFVYNFTKFFDWPQSEKTGDFVIGVLASNKLYYELVNVTTGKKVANQSIVIKKFKNVAEITECHVLFIPSNKALKITEATAQAGDHALIMSDASNSIKKGAVIKFYLSNDRLTYEFGKVNLAESGLKFHSKVEEMASRTY